MDELKKALKHQASLNNTKMQFVNIFDLVPGRKYRVLDLSKVGKERSLMYSAHGHPRISVSLQGDHGVLKTQLPESIKLSDKNIESFNNQDPDTNIFLIYKGKKSQWGEYFIDFE